MKTPQVQQDIVFLRENKTIPQLCAMIEDNAKIICIGHYVPQHIYDRLVEMFSVANAIFDIHQKGSIADQITNAFSTGAKACLVYRSAEVMEKSKRQDLLEIYDEEGETPVYFVTEADARKLARDDKVLIEYDNWSAIDSACLENNDCKEEVARMRVEVMCVTP